MTLAIVKVLPEPVTPIKTWSLRPARIPSTRAAIACGWSPAGLNGLTRSNCTQTTFIETQDVAPGDAVGLPLKHSEAVKADYGSAPVPADSDPLSILVRRVPHRENVVRLFICFFN